MTMLVHGFVLQSMEFVHHYTLLRLVGYLANNNGVVKMLVTRSGFTVYHTLVR